MSNSHWKARSSDLLTTTIQDELIVYDLRNDRAHSLNPIAAKIWTSCNGNRSSLEILQSLDPDSFESIDEDHILLGLQQLKEANLLESSGPETISVDRRDILKRIGIAAAVSLPLVSSIVIPTAVQAQSLLPNGTPCQNSPQCVSGNCVGVGGGVKECRPM